MVYLFHVPYRCPGRSTFFTSCVRAKKILRDRTYETVVATRATPAPPTLASHTQQQLGDSETLQLMT
ncbi:MAG: hypothetical protein ACJAX1_003159 [Neolewinella sp.]|jgi:hypothetical protein